MSVKFILGRGGSGKSTYMLDKIQERVQDNETSPVILLVPEQYTFEMEKKMSRLFTGDKKDKYFEKLLKIPSIKNQKDDTKTFSVQAEGNINDTKNLKFKFTDIR